MFKSMKRKAVVGMATAAAVIGLAGAAYAASVSNSDNFESGTLSAWNTTSNASADSISAKSGLYGGDVNSSAATGYLNWTTTAISQSHQYGVFRAWIKPVSVNSGESLDLISLTNTLNVNNFDFFIAGSGVDTGKFKWDLANANAATTSYTVTLGNWYLVEARVFYGSAGTYTADVQINGVPQTSITSTGMSAATVKSLWLGSNGAKTHRQYYDDVRLDVADTSPSYLGAPPAVRAGCTSGETVTVNGTLDTSGQSTTYSFEYGTSTSYGSSTSTTSAGSTIGEQNVSATLSGLTPNTVYHYRLDSTNGSGTTNGPDATFTTAARGSGC